MLRVNTIKIVAAALIASVLSVPAVVNAATPATGVLAVALMQPAYVPAAQLYNRFGEGCGGGNDKVQAESVLSARAGLGGYVGWDIHVAAGSPSMGVMTYAAGLKFQTCTYDISAPGSGLAGSLSGNVTFIAAQNSDFMGRVTWNLSPREFVAGLARFHGDTSSVQFSHTPPGATSGPQAGAGDFARAAPGTTAALSRRQEAKQILRELAAVKDASRNQRREVQTQAAGSAPAAAIADAAAPQESDGTAVPEGWFRVHASVETCKLANNHTTGPTPFTEAQADYCGAVYLHAHPMSGVDLKPVRTTYPDCTNVPDDQFGRNLPSMFSCLSLILDAKSIASLKESWVKACKISPSIPACATLPVTEGGPTPARVQAAKVKIAQEVAVMRATPPIGHLVCAPTTAPCAPHGMMKDAYEVRFIAQAGKSCDSVETRADIRSVYQAVYGGNVSDYQNEQKHIGEAKYSDGYACNTMAENARWGMVKNGAILFLRDRTYPSEFRGAIYFTGFVNTLSVMAGGTSK